MKRHGADGGQAEPRRRQSNSPPNRPTDRGGPAPATGGGSAVRRGAGRPAGPSDGRTAESNGGYWLSSRQAVAAALRRGRVRRLVVADGTRGLEEILSAAAAGRIAVERATRADLDRFAGTDAQGCAAWVDPIVPVELEARLAQLAGRPALLVACDHVQDPHNLGAIARTAEAAGAAALILPAHRAAGLSAGAERAAAGALQALPVAVVHNLTWALDRCRNAGFWAYGAAPDGEIDFAQADFASRSVLVVGAEDRGLSPLVRRHCDRIVRLPMRGTVQSLNAAVAAGILMYEWVRHVPLDARAH